MKIHHVLLNEFHGRDILETLCGRIINRVRGETGMTIKFSTPRCENFPIVQNPRDVTCNTCQHVWRKIK